MITPIESKNHQSHRHLLEVQPTDHHNKLNELEKKINRDIEDRKIKTHHGLILRNRIEERENDIRGYAEE